MKRPVTLGKGPLESPELLTEAFSLMSLLMTLNLFKIVLLELELISLGIDIVPKVFSVLILYRISLNNTPNSSMTNFNSTDLSVNSERLGI